LTIQDLGSIGELIAALATVATLAYLALQIRQNTRAIQGSALRESQALLSEAHFPMLNNPELGVVFEQGLNDPDSLSDAEADAFDLALYTVIATFQALYFQQRQSLLDSEIFDQQTRALIGYFRRPGGDKWWRATSCDFSPKFRSFSEKQIELAGGEIRDWRGKVLARNRDGTT